MGMDRKVQKKFKKWTGLERQFSFAEQSEPVYHTLFILFYTNGGSGLFAI